MRLTRMFSLAVLAVVAAMGLIGATSVSAMSTQLCSTHSGLTCSGSATSSVHYVLAEGTVGKLLAAIDVLCLGFLTDAGIGKFVSWLEIGGFKYIEGSAELSEENKPQPVQSVSQTFSNCGTGSTHSNCTVSTPQLPLFSLLKTGLDEGVLTATSGQTRLECSNLGLNCLYDVAGMEFSVGGGHLSVNELTTELGGKFLCPDKGVLDGLLESLTSTYVLG